MSSPAHEEVRGDDRICDSWVCRPDLIPDRVQKRKHRPDGNRAVFGCSRFHFRFLGSAK